MVEFKKITLEDREWINKRIQQAQIRSCDYSFVNNYIWRHPNHIEFADVNGFYCLKSGLDKQLRYTYPLGEGDIKPVIEALMQDAKEREIPFHLRGIPEQEIARIEEALPGVFTFTAPREESDYIYKTERLTTLSGKKLHGKRNHIARFKDNPNWVYEDITKENIADCMAMNEQWCAMYGCDSDESLQLEACAVSSAFRNFFTLNLIGGLLRRDGKVIAYTIGEPLTNDTMVVHIEKAFPDIQGAYPMINQQFVLNNCQDYEYVNREEDMGEEGLRKAKLSYYPDLLFDKYTATIKEGNE
ncbi:DUF2156 domain-containing protein [Anaerosporobacter faecicola]|uniref:DUF2156 domain-containing protein n=1 Tax=Anaerosporobacter faecicola TaxID=2718714 RepID=UPI00143AC946|nr:phosphatidylglycerol lysyltransferase domain-containing protein [Anaerosporobacter faecicola]